jgi:hypothetical protein
METKFASFEVPTASVLSIQVFWVVVVSMGFVNSRFATEMSGINNPATQRKTQKI